MPALPSPWERVLKTRSDAEGKYRFANLAESTYSVSVTTAGALVGSAGPFLLSRDQNKSLDITLRATPEFYDEPKFVVAGVTAGGYQGGHGSDVVLRSADTLAKETAALSTKSEPPLLNQDADRHHRLADANESEAKFVEAAHEYQRAAELAPSEPYLFDWGAELLRHHADEQAAEVFRRASLKYPDSVRILLGLATAYYAHGTYDEASKYFLAASDVNPNDLTPYLFLGKVQSSAVTQTAGFLRVMERFAKLHPENARANYFYAQSLWNQRKNAEESETTEHARILLERAIQIDPQFGPAYVLLGIVKDDVKYLERAVQVDPTLEEAHYRLAHIYRRTGETAKAQREYAVYEQLRKDSAERVKQQRNELQQFVFELRQ